MEAAKHKSDGKGESGMGNGLIGENKCWSYANGILTLMEGMNILWAKMITLGSLR